MEHGEVVERYLGKEREAQRVLGPFKHSLFQEVHVSPFGVIPKADPGKWRLILDLSSSRGNSGLQKNYVLSHMSQLMT